MQGSMPTGASIERGVVGSLDQARGVFSPEVAPSAGSRHRARLVLGLLLASFLGLQMLLPLGTAVKIGADEGFELSKATLCAHGYKLYTEIWNDQPPLNTSILMGLMRHVSPPILGPRLLSVSLALVLLSAFFNLIVRLNGVLIAGLATAMLVASPGFMELSSSCMQEVPALTPIVAALCLLLALPRAEWHMGEILAGVLFGLGLQLKLIGVIYLPLAVLVVWLVRRQRPDALKAAVISSAVLIAAAAVVFVGLNLLTGNPLLVQLHQSWAAHFSSTKSFEYGSPAERPYEWVVLIRNWDTTVPALVGAAALLLAMRPKKRSTSVRSSFALAALPYTKGREGRATSGQQLHSQSPGPLNPSGDHLLLPLSWLALTLVVFTTHKPWWSYYYLHNSVPFCWCAAIGFAVLWHRFSKGGTSAFHRERSVFAAVLVGLFCAGAFSWMAARVYLQETGIRGSSRLDSCLALKEIARFRPFTTFLFAYDPIYSFHSDIPTPPHLAMISLKRLWSGEMTTARLVSEVESVKPGLILLSNDATEHPFQGLLNREYRLVYQDASGLLYAHRSISRKPLQALAAEPAPRSPTMNQNTQNE